MAPNWIIGTELCSSVAKAVRSRISVEELPYIYKDKPRQNFQYCSLYIDVLNLEQQKQMRNTYNRTAFLDLRLHPLRNQDDAQTWCRNMAERIIDATARIEFKGSLIACPLSETYYIEKNNEQVQHIILVYPYRAIRLDNDLNDLKYMEILDDYYTINYGEE